MPLKVTLTPQAMCPMVKWLCEVGKERLLLLEHIPGLKELPLRKLVKVYLMEPCQPRRVVKSGLLAETSDPHRNQHIQGAR
jgi:hypothetical protein